MKRFQFQLKRVLEWRESRLNAEEAKLAALNQRITALEAALDELRARRVRLKVEIAAAALLEGAQLKAMAAHLLQLERNEKSLLVDKQSCATRIVEQQRAVFQARQQHRALEMLQDRRLKGWLYEAGREEDKQVSELFLASWKKDAR